MNTSTLPTFTIEAIANGFHGDPFSLLGPHKLPDKGVVIRAMQPTAQNCHLVYSNGKTAEMSRLHHNGMFEIILPRRKTIPKHYKFRVIELDGWQTELEDPYRFPSQLGEYDAYLFNEGTDEKVYEKLGAHLTEIDGVNGVRFAVWAPAAQRVSVVGDFNRWNERQHPMRFHPNTGIWELFIPDLGQGTVYKYQLLSHHSGYRVMKTDPYGFYSELRPQNASVVYEIGGYEWGDDGWMANRPQFNHPTAPMSVYEVHLGSWRRKGEDGEEFLSYDELAKTLIPYVLEMGFTHIELLPIMEYPYDGSWGYQVTGFFAPTSRFGEPKQFMAFVDACHQAGIGVILDWVPAHFPTDEHGLGYFDGTHLYEHADPREGFHPDWETYIFNYGRAPIRQFLISNALFWLEKYHIDGLRVDAVASMLYRDFSRAPGEWVANRFGGRENLEAIAFLKEFNRRAHQHFPSALTIAEESTSYPLVTAPIKDGGLGFDLKWNMGWMHDTLKYMGNDPIYRAFHHGAMTFSLMYAFSEKFVLPFSHDEVVHLKKAMLDKMPGDLWNKFANLRALYAYQWAHPGKKLTFMGGEFGQWREWSEQRSLDWHLVEQMPEHRGLQALVADLNKLHREMPAFHRTDFHPDGFEWVDFHDAEASVFIFWRRGGEDDEPVLAVCHFTPLTRENYPVGAPNAGIYAEILNSDDEKYGGSGVLNPPMTTEPTNWHRQPHSLRLTLPPLSVLYLQLSEKFPDEEE